MPLGELGRCAAQDLDLLFEDAVAPAQFTVLLGLGRCHAGSSTDFDVGHFFIHS